MDKGIDTNRANAALIDSLNGILALWTSPEFLTGVAAREGVDLDPGAITVVTILNAGGPQRPSSLATRMVTGASNISKITARLLEGGLVEKLPDPADSRASLIALTSAGTEVAEALTRSGNSLADELIGGWPAGDRAELLRLLTNFEAESRRVGAALKQATA